MRVTKSYSIDRSVDDYVRRTSRGRRSVSQRVNELLHRAIEIEEEASLEKEAARFFGSLGAEERAETGAFQKAAVASITRE